MSNQWKEQFQLLCLIYIHFNKQMTYVLCIVFVYRINQMTVRLQNNNQFLVSENDSFKNFITYCFI